MSVCVCVQEKFVVVMSASGVMYSQPVIPACNAVEGPVYFTIDLGVIYPSGGVTGTTSPQGEDEVMLWEGGREERREDC